ncbi:hypothetical protein CBR_g32316 [Chara braunii]|uniref:Tetratricopeptide repeat protein 29 n=1 Tax=Chara braunii TaxID=69332 RepID=A0A388JNH5_CHABU|nr:hypothetical protein CBR_g32316 [Chara braunii]|eukprot:GBG59303.1 hypothetical protein CBR_g32316 [Chara braunii]
MPDSSEPPRTMYGAAPLLPRYLDNRSFCDATKLRPRSLLTMEKDVRLLRLGAKTQASELPGYPEASLFEIGIKIAEKLVDPRDIEDGITPKEYVAIREEEAQMVATIFSWWSDNYFLASPPLRDTKAIHTKHVSVIIHGQPYELHMRECVPDKTHQLIADILTEYRDTISVKDAHIGLSVIIQREIRTDNHPPIHCKLYRQGCQTYSMLADEAESMGELEQSIEFNEKCIQIAMQANDEAEEGLAKHRIGNLWQRLNQPRTAIDYQQQYLAICRSNNNKISGRRYHDLRYHKRISRADITMQISPPQISAPQTSRADITMQITRPQISPPQISRRDITMQISRADNTTSDITSRYHDGDITTSDITSRYHDGDITTSDITSRYHDLRSDITTSDITTSAITTSDITTSDITSRYHDPRYHEQISRPQISRADITTSELRLTPGLQKMPSAYTRPTPPKA